MSGGIVSYGVYVPYFRLRREAIAEAVGPAGGSSGTRSVASFDEDTTSMGVEAARAALRGAPAAAPRALYFATSAPAYLDKTNAAAVHAALGLERDGFAVDMNGAVRSGVGALRAAADTAQTTLAVLSDMRGGLPGGGDEAEGGDGAAAFLFGDGAVAPVAAEVVAVGSSTAEFLDRWRIPGEGASRRWEERFGEQVYLPLAQEAATGAFKAAGVAPESIDHLAVAGTHGRAVRRVSGLLATGPQVLVDDLATTVGNTGTAHPGMLLAAVLDRAEPGQLIVLVILADGADVLILRATDALPELRRRLDRSVGEHVAAGTGEVSYPAFLTWRGILRREPPRRPPQQPPAAPPAHRDVDWKFALEGSRCTHCGTRHLPAARVCAGCRTVDAMAPERFTEVPGTIATYTIDRLAFSQNPPVVVGVVDFDGGGRFQCELADVVPDEVDIGDRVEMTFRRMFTAEGVHNYFWKARPVRATGERSS